MKKFITAVFCTAFALSSRLTAYAAEALDRDTIESAVWEDIWNGKGNNGLKYPEASYKHHLLDKWLDENYGTGGLDWSDAGEIKHEYRSYYRELIDGWDFEDDNSGKWTIETESNHYSFTMLNGNWQMIDPNGDTVDSFPPFSTLKDDDSEESTGNFEINDNGEDSPRVIGDVTGRTVTASKGSSVTEYNNTVEGSTKPSKDNSASL